MFIDEDEVSIIENDVEKKVEKKPETKKVIYKTFDSSELVHFDKTFEVDADDFFNKANYPYSLNFYDFEVFMGDWLVVIINPIERVKKIIANDRDALVQYYKYHKNQIWVGYNSRNYDTYILKSILLEMNPKKVNDMIILYGLKGWQINDDFKDIPLLNFDVASRIVGLKQLEGFMGNDIRETTVPFDLDRPLNRMEMKETIKYCMHDVEQTMEVFKRRKNEYDAIMGLIETFDLPISSINLTKAQITANILDCQKTEHDDEFDIDIVDALEIKKYKKVVDWFKNPKNHDYKNSLTIDVCGIPHTFGWGGLHGCPDIPIHIKDTL